MYEPPVDKGSDKIRLNDYVCHPEPISFVDKCHGTLDQASRDITTWLAGRTG